MMPQKPSPRTGLPHLIAATGYSLAGLARLWREAAFRQEVFAGGAGLLILLVSGAAIHSLAIFVMLLMALLAGFGKSRTAITESRGQAFQ